jgi:hypothetical protein
MVHPMARGIGPVKSEACAGESRPLERWRARRAPCLAMRSMQGTSDVGVAIAGKVVGRRVSMRIT